MWPNNETLGLPQGLNQDPFDINGFLGLLPGLGCAGTGSSTGFLGSASPRGVPNCVLPLAVFALVAKHSFGAHREVSHCENTVGTPDRYGNCTFSCETRDGANGEENVNMAQLRKACGPITKCPRDILVETNVFWVFGIGIPLTDPTVTQCAP